MKSEDLADLMDLPHFESIPVLLFGFVAVLIILSALFVFRTCSSGKPPKYRRSGPLLTRGEVAFYNVLKVSIPGTTLLFIKVRLADIIEVAAEGGKSSWIGAFNKISQKHVDFVLCDDASFAVVCVIELDDKSHRQFKSRKSDFIKNTALAQAGIPVLRVPASGFYSREYLSRSIVDSLAPKV